MRPWISLFQNSELLPQSQVLQEEVTMRADEANKRRKQQP